ncbi:hypothetical protein S245_023525, partial [Arachis hypogaea]
GLIFISSVIDNSEKKCTSKMVRAKPSIQSSKRYMQEVGGFSGFESKSASMDGVLNRSNK